MNILVQLVQFRALQHFTPNIEKVVSNRKQHYPSS
jgi:hypothetical protein